MHSFLFQAIPSFLPSVSMVCYYTFASCYILNLFPRTLSIHTHTHTHTQLSKTQPVPVLIARSLDSGKGENLTGYEHVYTSFSFFFLNQTMCVKWRKRKGRNKPNTVFFFRQFLQIGGYFSASIRSKLNVA